MNQVETILSAPKKLLTEVYFDLQRYFEEKYGSNSIVLMEIGSFFEVYEVNNDELKIGKAKEISELLNIQLTRKNKSILENSISNPLLAGVPSVMHPSKRYTISKTKKMPMRMGILNTFIKTINIISYLCVKNTTSCPQWQD